MAYRNKDWEWIGQDWFVEADNSKNFDSWRRRNILTETQRDLSNEEANLIASNIWVEKNIVFAEASEVIPLDKWTSVEKMIQAIRDYQSKHLLDIDGKIWKQTYEEIKAQRYFSNKLLDYQVNWISKKDQDLIIKTLRNLKSWSLMYRDIIISVNWLEEALKQVNNQTRLNEYRDFFAEVNRIKDNYKNSPQFKNDLAENAWPRESVYLTFKKIAKWEIPVWEWLKQLWGDPRTRFVLSIMLIFWIFPDELKSKIPLMWSFFKRLILLWLITTMWSGVVKWAWIDDMMKDVDEAFEKAKSAAKWLPSPTQAKWDLWAGARDWYKATWEVIEDIKNGKAPPWLKKYWEWLAKMVRNSWRKLNKSFDQVTEFFQNKVTMLVNRNAKLLGDKEDLAVPLKEYNSILEISLNYNDNDSENNFANIRIIDAKNAAEKGTIFNYFSEEQKKALKEKFPNEEIRSKYVKNTVLQICKEWEWLWDEALIWNIFFWEDYDSLIWEEKYIEDGLLDHKIKNLVKEIKNEDVKKEVMRMAGVLWRTSPEKAIKQLNSINEKTNKEDKKRIEKIIEIYQMKLDFDNWIEYLKSIKEVPSGWASEISKKIIELEDKRAKLFDKYKASLLASNLRKEYSKIYFEKDLLLLKWIPTGYKFDEPNLWKDFYPWMEAQDRKELFIDKEKIDEAYSKIWNLPTDWWNLDKFYSYFTDETAISLKNILEISEKYDKREKTITGLEGKTVDNRTFYEFNWNLDNLSYEEQFTVDILLKYTEAQKRIEDVKNTIDNLKNGDIETINNLKKELDENSKNAINFQANRKNYEEKIKEICWKIYKNKLPDNLSEIWDSINWANTVSRYKELENRMKIIYDDANLWADKVSEALLGLEIYFKEKSWEAKQESIISKSGEKLINTKLFDSYKSLYKKFQDILWNDFYLYKEFIPDPNSSDVEDMTMKGLSDNLTVFYEELKKGGLYSKVGKYAEKFNKELEEYYLSEK